MKFNDEQQLAIDTTERNILVSAGAGSGKTAVLTERVIKIITDPDTDTDIDNLLILTFTANAAAEMRKRITDRLKELRDELLLHPSEAKKLLKVRKQINLVNRASISTFDAFANSIVKQYFYKVGVDPGIRIAGGDDSSELVKISNDVLDELFEEKYASNDSEFLMLVDYFCFSDNNDTPLKNILLNILYKTSALPFPDKWLDSAQTLYDVSEGKDTLLFSLVAQRIEYMHYRVVPTYKKSISLLQMLKEKYNDYYEEKNNALVAYENCFNGIKNVLVNVHKKIITSKTFDDAASYLDEFKIPRLPPKTKMADAPEEIINNCSLINDYKKIISEKYANPAKKLITDCNFSNPVIKRQKEIIDALIKLYKEFNSAYTLKKKELMVASYADINHYCLNILVNENGNPSDEAYALGGKFKEIIVDEYQDNNHLQEEILNTLTIGRKNLFMVGDVKQSIYGFRYASPEIFTHKYNNYSKDDFSKDDICICLNKNYRSRKKVIDFVNFVFYQVMIEELGGIRYDEYAALNFAAEYGKAPEQAEERICRQNELIIYNKAGSFAENDDENNEISQLYEVDYEAHIAAKKIVELTDRDNPVYIYDKSGKYRPCTLSDIAIIMSRPNKYLHQYESILGSYGIPVIAESKTNIFNTIEVKTVMSLLKVLDNPYRDTPLITVLHSPMFSVSCDELVRLKLDTFKNKLTNKHDSFYTCMLKYINMNNANSVLKEKLEAFLSLSEKVKEMLRTMPFCYVLGRLYDMTDYINYTGIIKNGAIRVNNLKILLKKSEEICNSGITDFTSIVKQLSEMEKRGEEITNETSKLAYDAVNIMSIHKSKGLEYPIIIVTQLGHSLISPNKNVSVEINTEYGIAFKDFNAEKREKQDSIQLDCFKALNKKSAVSENLRLLYVAMTRAREKLIMIGGADINKEPEFFHDSYAIYEENEAQSVTLDFDKIHDAPNFLTLVMNAYKHGKNLSSDLSSELKDIDIDQILKITRLTDNISLNDNEDISYIKRLLDEADSKEDTDSEKEKLDNKLNRSYLDDAAVILPSKLSISEIKRQHQLEKYNQLEYDLMSFDAPSADNILKKLTINKKQETAVQLDPPDFIYENSDKLTSTQYGTAYHTAFEYIDFAKNNIEEIKNQLLKLKNDGIFSDMEYKAVKPEKILALLNSDLGKRIAASKKVYKETPFVMKLSPQEVYRSNKYGNTTAKMLVHGIIDLFFEENDGIILVDYKTDKVDDSLNTKENIAERYRIQLDFYKMAIDRSYSMYNDSSASKKRVKEMYLYLINTNEYVAVKDFEE